MSRFASFWSMLESVDPSHPCFEFASAEGKAILTYGQVLQQVRDYPLPKEHSVGIFATTSPAAVIALLALIGKRRVILLNPEDNEGTLALQIASSHVDCLIGEDEELIESLAPHIYHGEHDEDNDVLFFTSGTTSKAKAVQLTESSLCSAAYNGGSLLPLSPKDSMLCCLPLSHVFGFVCSFLWPLSFGAKICLGRGLRSVFFDFDFFRPTVASLVPQMAGFLAMKRLFNPELKLILIGAGDCPDAILGLIKSLGIRVSFGYGLTESSSGIALSLGDDPRAMTICPDYEVRLGDDGEILVKSATTLMKGYYHDPEHSEATLKDGYLHTGDLGKIVDGKLFITGRKKEILVFNDGSKLFLPEFEQELSARLGPESDFALVQRKDGTAALYIHRPTKVEHIVDEWNKGLPLSHRVNKIVYAPSPLPRTKTNKVQRYLIPTIE